MLRFIFLVFFFFFNDTATTEIYTLSLHDALPISPQWPTSKRRLESQPLQGQSPAGTVPLDLPSAAAEHGHLAAVGGQTRHLHVVAADHEVDVDCALVDLRHVLGADGELVGVPERDVARGILVEQGVVEGRAERPDPAFAVDEGKLAEPRGVRVVAGALA